MARCLIGCGSNQGRPLQHLAEALELLRAMPGLSVVAASRFRRTRPVGGPPGQEAFLNGAILVDTAFSPRELLGVLTAVENTLHRDRSERWGPRSIDLDLLLYEAAVLDEADLTVPHPRMATRRFVLEPCVEIAPDFIHPLAGCSLRDLLDDISRPHPHVAVVGVPGSGAREVAAAVADAVLARPLHAPACLPPLADDAATFERGWLAAVAECAAAIHADAWPDDPHGTVADFWLGTFLVAAEGRLPAADRAFRRLAAGTVTPHVAILLVADAAVLEERLAFRSRRPPPLTDMFSDLAGAATAVADAPPPTGGVGPLVALQERLRRRLLEPGRDAADRPRAVVVVSADDLGAALAEAVAAVEAMA